GVRPGGRLGLGGKSGSGRRQEAQDLRLLSGKDGLQVVGQDSGRGHDAKAIPAGGESDPPAPEVFEEGDRSHSSSSSSASARASAGVADSGTRVSETLSESSFSRVPE